MCIQCCKCHKVVVKGEWMEPPQKLPAEVSHTYCPARLDATLFDLSRVKWLAKRATNEATLTN